MNETTRPKGVPQHPRQPVASQSAKRIASSPSYYDFLDPDLETDRLAGDVFAGALDHLPPAEPGNSRRGGRGSSLRIGGSPFVNANSHLRSSTYASTSFAETGNLADWDTKPEAAGALARLLGISAVEGEVSPWRVGKTELAVRLWRDERGLFVLRIDKGWPGGRKALALHEAFATHVTGDLRFKRRGPELGLWKWRMLVELDFVKPPHLKLPQLPSDAPEKVMKTWPKIGALLALRGLTGRPESEGFPLSAPWFAKWSGLSEPTVRAAKRWLTTRGILVRIGNAPASFGRPTDLWTIAPGKSPEVKSG